MNDESRKDQIFDAVIQIEDQQQQAAALDRLCGDNEELKEEILDLISHDRRLGSFLEEPPTVIRTGESDTTPDAANESVPSIPNYRLVKVLGQGGMGTVWLAEQEKPVRRQVALKLVRSDFNGTKIIARFEAERQALALMDHPNIAKVLEAGTTSTGVPFFVMELVQGVPLNRYCDDHKLSVNERLSLFVQVCNAVGHAHQKGIIHRDLKPSNVLVEEFEGNAVAKVIDFGLAKATQAELKLTDESLHTEFGRVVGTVQYMSPEQADSKSRDVDTRSDIYSLGVILFELLTGSTPLQKELVDRTNLLEVLNLLRDNKITVRPSDRIETSVNPNEAVGSYLRIAPTKLRNILRGELDWIVMKALNGERSRRYETVNALSDDILRFVHQEPVLARPPSTSYRLRKFVQKNRGWVTAASIIVVLLIAGTIGTSVGFYKASLNAESERGAKNLALKQKKLADKKSNEARIAAEESNASAKRSSEALDIFSNAFQSVNPDSWPDPDMKAVDVLNQAKEALASSELDDEGRIVLLQSLSRSYSALAEYNSAVETTEELAALLEKQLGRYHADTVLSLIELGRAYVSAGVFEKAIPIYEEIFNHRKASHGTNDELTLSIMNNLGLAYQSADRPKDALKLFQDVVDLREKYAMGGREGMLSAMINLGGTLVLMDRYEKATEVLESARQMAKQTGISRTNKNTLMTELAHARMQNGETAEAIRILKELLDYCEEFFGVDSRDTMTCRSNLAMTYRAAGRVNDSLPLLEKVYQGLNEHSGESHPDTLKSMHNLAGVYAETGSIDKAIPMLEECLDRYLQKLGPAHTDTRTTKNSLALTYANSGNVKEAIRLFRELTEQSEELNGPLHPQTIRIRNNLTYALYKNNQFDEVLDIKETTLQAVINKFGPTHPQTVNLMQDLGRTCWKFKLYDKSVPLFEKVVEYKTEAHGPDAFETLKSIGELGVNFNDSGDFDSAIPMLERAFDASAKFTELAYLRRHLREAYVRGERINKFRELIEGEIKEIELKHHADSIQLATVLVYVGLDFIRIGEPSEAESHLRVALEGGNRSGQSEWFTFYAQSLLGEALMDQDKFDESEEMLSVGYQGLKKTRDDIPDSIREKRLSEARERVIRLGRRTDNADLIERLESDNTDG